MKYTKEQEEIILLDGNVVVSANAGTGKTYTLVEKIEHELKNNHNHKFIAAITFTIKASDEIKDRLKINLSSNFVGTNNRFAIDEIIRPFCKDVYGDDFDIDIDTDYTKTISSFEEGGVSTL